VTGHERPPVACAGGLSWPIGVPSHILPTLRMAAARLAASGRTEQPVTWTIVGRLPRRSGLRAATTQITAANLAIRAQLVSERHPRNHTPEQEPPDCLPTRSHSRFTGTPTMQRVATAPPRLEAQRAVPTGR
jgi:hypothetical protein